MRYCLNGAFAVVGLAFFCGCRSVPPAADAAAFPARGICAHRGDRAAYPENTVPAFLAAVEKGAAMVEFDVTRCATGELVVMHDWTIDRTTTGTGVVSQLSFDYLRSVDAGVKKSSAYRGVKIPTFDEAIDCFPKTGVWLNVHCKSDVTDEVARKIKAKGRLAQAFIAADLAGVRKARAAVPEVKVCLFAAPGNSWGHAWTAEERQAAIAAVRAEKAEFTQPHYASFEPEELAAYHAEGGKVNYFWCNKPGRLGALMARGIDFPLTDNLEPMVAEFRRLSRAWDVPDQEYPFGYVTDSLPTAAPGSVRRPDWAHEPARRAFGGIPSLAVSPKNGRLWATWYAGPTDGEDSNNYAVLATSGDGGRTWREVLYADPDMDGALRAFDPEVWVAPDGRLRWTWTEREVKIRDGGSNRWTTGCYFANTDRLKCLELSAEDEPPEPLPEPRQIARGVMMCKPIVAKDGRWLFPVATWYDDFSARVVASGDGGRTFGVLGGVSLPEKMRLFDEHNLIELKDGTLRAYLRTRNSGDAAWQADSRDGGKTWGPARPCPFRHVSSRFFVRRLKSGALLLVKNGALDYGDSRDELTAFVSDDDGASWIGGLVLKKGPCAYPDGDQAPDGTLFVTCDNDRMGRQEIRLFRFTEADVRAGRCVSPTADLDGFVSVRKEAGK